MDRATGATPDFDLEIDPFYTAIERLNIGAQEYHQSCRVYARRPFTNSQRHIEEGLGAQMAEFTNAIRAMENESGPQEIMNAGSAIILSNSAERATELNKIVGKELLRPLEGNSIALDISQWEDLSPEELKKNIIEDRVQLFNARMSEDTVEFVMCIAQTKIGRRVEMAHEITAHALEVGKDVGKIALGTALGMLAARVISKKS